MGTPLQPGECAAPAQGYFLMETLFDRLGLWPLWNLRTKTMLVTGADGIVTRWEVPTAAVGVVMAEATARGYRAVRE